jgi:hypothetical protein
VSPVVFPLWGEVAGWIPSIRAWITKKKKGDMAKGNKFANPYKGLVVVYRIAYDLSR